jgi:hypothetical protein
MSSDSLLTVDEESSKESFSRWRCIFTPQSAVDRKRGGYAKLELHIERAVSLLAADANGKSDPYVVVEINNKRTGHKTAVAPMTLAPTWNDSFDLPIHYPDSILTLLIYDSDMLKITADRLHQIDERLVGGRVGRTFVKNGIASNLLERCCSDDFIGFVDIQLNLLPYNQEFQGWFPVHHPKNFTDSAQGRIRKAANLAKKDEESGSDPGQIRLKMNLQVEHCFGEMFASCIGPPHLGVPAPDLDIVQWYNNIRELADKAQVVQEKIQSVVQFFERHNAIILILVMVLVQMPIYILPLLLTCILFALAYSFWAISKADAGNSCQHCDEPPSELNKELVNSLAAILPKDHERDLRLNQEQTQIILESVRNWENIFSNRGQGIAVLVALGLVCAALVLMKDWQGWIVRNGITVGCFVTLVGQSCPFRVAQGVARYVLRPHRRLRSLRAQENVADEESRTSISRRDIAKLTFQRRNTTFGDALRGVVKTPSLTPTMIPHDPEDAHVAFPHKCDDCGAYIWGKIKRCRACGHSLCSRCADTKAPQCTTRMRKQSGESSSSWLCGATPDMKLCSWEWSPDEGQEEYGHHSSSTNPGIRHDPMNSVPV